MRKSIVTLVALFLAVLFLLPLAPMSAAVNTADIQVVLDGTPLAFDVQPRMERNRVLVPVRAIAEALGGEVSWDAPTHRVTIQTEEDIVILTIGRERFTVNGETRQMDVAPRIVGNRTLVPVRFVAEALDRCVDWIRASRTVTINTPGETRKLPFYDMTHPLQNAEGISVHNFVFDDGIILNWNDRPIPVPMAGIIAAPNTAGPHPVIFLFHGVTRVDSIRDPIYAGFDYLVQQLAAEGFVALSINFNINYHWEEAGGEPIWGDWAHQIFELHIDLLRQANAGEHEGHGLNLAGMVNLDEIHLIGHSRGGEVVDTLYRLDRKADISRIHSLIRIAPVIIPYQVEDNAHLNAGPHPSVPVGIILSEFDGDLLNNEGQSVFDEVLAEGTVTSLLSLVYLRGANHNFFNRAFEFDDATQEVNRITRAQQEDFMMRYAAAFLAIARGNRTPWGAFSAAYAQPETMFGYRVIASTYIPAPRPVIASPSADTAAAVNTGGGASAALYVQAWDSEGYFAHAGLDGDARLPLYDIQWTTGGATAAFPVLVNNFSAHRALSLYIAVDSSNALNPQGQDQALTITLQNTAGESRSVLIPQGTPALSWHPGYLEYHEWTEAYFWVGLMPLGELRIPLALFGGMDLSNIAELTISFDQTDLGAVMLSAIYLT